MNPLLAFAALTGAVSIGADLAGLYVLTLTSKLATTLLIIVYAARRSTEGFYARAILAGLGVSLVGDAFLASPQSGFMPGLVSFLLAHFAYLYAFFRRSGGALSYPAALGCAVAAAVLLSVLWPHLPEELRIPVFVYATALATMTLAAISMHLRLRSQETRAAAFGGSLFMASDALLAFNLFTGAVPLATLWVHATYWVAQALIASSIDRARRA